MRVEPLVNRDELEAAAEEYVANVLGTIKSDISTDRATKVEQERANLEAYAKAERERIQAFISEYQQQADAGEDMEISIRGQRRRLDRLDERKTELESRRQVISLAPEVEGYCLTLPIQ